MITDQGERSVLPDFLIYGRLYTSDYKTLIDFFVYKN